MRELSDPSSPRVARARCREIVSRARARRRRGAADQHAAGVQSRTRRIQAAARGEGRCTVAYAGCTRSAARGVLGRSAQASAQRRTARLVAVPLADETRKPGVWIAPAPHPLAASTQHGLAKFVYMYKYEEVAVAVVLSPTAAADQRSR